MIEGLQAEGLTLRVCSEIRLESVGIDDGDVGLHGVEGRSRFGDVLRHMTTAASEHLVDCWDAVLRRLNLDKVDGLFKSREVSRLIARGE